MKRFLRSRQMWAGALVAATAVAGLAVKGVVAQSSRSGAPAAAQEEPIKRTVLFRGKLEGVDGKEIVIFVADLAPGAVGAKHYHPGPEYFYVIEGTLVHEPDGDHGHTMKVGEFGSNPNKGIHTIRNPDTTARAKAIDFLIADTGQPLVVPVK